MKVKNITKIMGGAIAALALAVLPNSVMAWGPERTTFTNASPATYVTFNSITDNAGIGDETNFVRVREAGVGEFVDSVNVEAGKTYEVYIYYHNNAASNLNLTANGTKLYAYFPGVLPANGSAKTGATISAANANPTRVWDEATFTTNDPVGMMMKYVENSAVMHNAGGANGMTLSEDLFDVGGTLIGYDALNGNIPGCAEYSGYITYQLKAEQAAMYISKMVSRDGQNYYDEISANIGDTVYYKVLGKNVGSADLKVTSGHDLLTTGLVATSDAKFKGLASGNELILDSFFVRAGNALGNLGVGGPGFEITYSAKITSEAIDGLCGSSQLINGVYVSYELASDSTLGGVISNHAAVNVSDPCETPSEMPKTGGDFGEMIMMMVTSIAATGAISYVIWGISMSKRSKAAAWQGQDAQSNFSDQNNKGMGI